jgi:hypothetical protein
MKNVKVDVVHAEVNKKLPEEKIVESIAAQNKEMMFVDCEGRTIKVKEPEILDEYDLMRSMGTDATLMGCLVLTSVLMYIESIDNEAFIIPHSMGEVRAALKRIGRKSLREIQKKVFEFGLIQTEEEAKVEVKK